MLTSTSAWSGNNITIIKDIQNVNTTLFAEVCLFAYMLGFSKHIEARELGEAAWRTHNVFLWLGTISQTR